MSALVPFLLTDCLWQSRQTIIMYVSNVDIKYHDHISILSDPDISD